MHAHCIYTSWCMCLQFYRTTKERLPRYIWQIITFKAAVHLLAKVMFNHGVLLAADYKLLHLFHTLTSHTLPIITNILQHLSHKITSHTTHLTLPIITNILQHLPHNITPHTSHISHYTSHTLPIITNILQHLPHNITSHTSHHNVTSLTHTIPYYMQLQIVKGQNVHEKALLL